METGSKLVVGRGEAGLTVDDRIEERDQPGIPLEGLPDRAPSPEEHAGVPGHARFPQEGLGPIVRRLLLEGPQRIGLEPIDQLAVVEPGDEVAVLGGGPIDVDAERDERRLDVERALGQARGSRQDRPEDVLAFDRMVGRQDEHDLVVRSIDEDSGEGNRRRRVPPGRFGDHPDARALGPHEVPVPPIGDHRDVQRGHGELHVIANAVDRELQERPAAEKRQERLGCLGTAQRPEPRAAAPGEDHHVHRGDRIRPGRRRWGARAGLRA